MEEDDELFEVECLLNTRVKDGKRYYKVRWKGFPPEEDTWEPEENVLECEEVLEAFWRKRKRRSNQRQKIRRYRLMSEEEDQDTASTSRQNKPTELFGDIEPLGLTRQASKELAMCLNKTRKKSKRNSESSSQAGSDVTITESDVLTQPCSQSTLLSSRPESDASLFSQGADIKSSETGSDVLNRSTESTNDSNSTFDVINISSQESLNQSDLECSPRVTLDKEKKSNNGKTNKIEIISLLSDSEDNEGDRTGSQPSGTQSPHVLQSPLDVSRGSSPVILREYFKTPESTPPKSSPSFETSESEKITSSKENPSSSRESEENPSKLQTQVKRKNRFELSLKKNRRSLKKSESSSPGSPKNEEKVAKVGVKNRDSFSHEKVEKTEVKTPLQLLKEKMTEVENSEKMLGKSDSKLLEISRPKAKRTLIEETEPSENLIDDECPMISQLKGIMHKIARDKYQQGLEVSLRGTEMDGMKYQESSDISASLTSDLSKAKTSESISSGEGRDAEKMMSGDNVAHKEIALELCNSCVSEQILVKDEAAFPFSERVSSVEKRESSNNVDEDVMKSLKKTESKDEKLKDFQKLSSLSGLEMGVDSKRRCNEEDEKSIGEVISENDQEMKNIKEKTVAVVPSSSKKTLPLTSETTSRVLKNLRFLAAKNRESKSVETTTEEKNDEANCKNVEGENNFGNMNGDNGNAKLIQDEELIGIKKNINEIGNIMVKEIGEIVGVEGGNETGGINEKKKDNGVSGLINKKNIPNDDQNVETCQDIKSVVEDKYNKYTEINDQTERMSCVGSLTDEETKPALPETKEAPAQTLKLSKSGIDSLSRKEKTGEPNDKDKTSNNFSLVEEDFMSIDLNICRNIPITKIPKSPPTVQPLSIHEATRTQGCHGDDEIEETLTENLQKHSAMDGKPDEDKDKQKIGKTRKMLNKNHEKATPGKTAKRKKRSQLDTNNLSSKNLNSNKGVDNETDVSSATTKKKFHNSKAKRTTKKQTKITKDDENNSIAKNVNPPLQNTREELSKKSLILDANFTSSLSSGDLIGAIIDEGDRETTMKDNQKKSSVAENNNSKDLVAAREEEDMVIEDDEDFDFELEDFPLEKLLQEEDDIDLRCIPSPPVEPMDVPFASVKTAIRDGDEMTVRAALAGGLELDTLDGASGMTLLMLASASGQDNVVELLLRRKADVNACQKNGMTALMHACEQGYPDTAHVLLLCGADINKHQIAGETALMKACKKGHTDVVEVLLRNGADTRMESKSGHTAQQFAIRGFPELSSLIEEHEKRMGRAVEEAILKCLGDTVSLCKPAILSYRCVVPREGQQMTLPFHYSSQLYNKEVDVILFCIKAVFEDAVSLLFGEDNGVRGVLLNNKPQIPLLHGVRSIFSIDPKSRQNTITLQTHKCSNPASRIILCIYAVQGKS